MTSAGGNIHVIEGKGSTHVSLLSGEIKSIKDVKYVSSLRRNILSIGKLTDDGNIAVFLSEFLRYIYLHKTTYSTCFETVR